MKIYRACKEFFILLALTVCIAFAAWALIGLFAASWSYSLAYFYIPPQDWFGLFRVILLVYALLSVCFSFAGAIDAYED